MMLLKEMYMMNWLKKVNAIRTADICDLFKKAYYNTKIIKKTFNYGKYVTTINKLTKDNFDEGLK